MVPSTPRRIIFSVRGTFQSTNNAKLYIWSGSIAAAIANSNQLGLASLSFRYTVLAIVALFMGGTMAEVIEETGMFGELITPGYPETYSDNLDLQWNITVPKGYQIRLYFTVFDVEYSADCEYDYLKV